MAIREIITWLLIGRRMAELRLVVVSSEQRSHKVSDMTNFTVKILIFFRHFMWIIMHRLDVWEMAMVIAQDALDHISKKSVEPLKAF
jgi:hypothetical protein